MNSIQKYLFPIVIGTALFLTGSVLALNKDNIVFPVAELGDCQNEQECKAYCDDRSHIDECIVFAEKYNLLSPNEIEKAKKFREIGAGPGGCTTDRECKTYCNDITNIQECIAFAEQHGFIPPKELEEAKRVAKALQHGAQLPGGCTSKNACEAYCEAPSHMRECIKFAEAAGFIPPEELKEAKQVLKAIEAGVPPPNCRGKKECDVYCQEPSHMEECVNFALAAGLIPPEEAAQVRRILPLMKAGKMPGECQKGKEKCEAYCSKDENIEECSVFFVEAGFMTPEDAAMFKKTKGKGPGDCKGKEECEAFCNNPQNQQTCFEFAQKYGLISQEDLRNVEEGMRQMKKGIETAPSEVAQCLKETIGEKVLAKIRAGTFMPNPQLGDLMRKCFEDFMAKQQQAMEQRMQECLAMPCEQAFACLENMPAGGGPGEGQEEGKGPGDPSGFEQAIQAKIDSCMQQQQREQGSNVSEEYRQFLPENVEGMSPKEVERIIRESAEQQMRQQMKEQFSPLQQGPGPAGSFEQGFQELKPLLPQQELLGPPENLKGESAPQQFVPPAEQAPQETPEIQGNILEAAGWLLRQLFFGI